MLAQRQAAAAADTGYADENLHYTNDHPKPLAVCTLGGRRIVGLLIADGSQFLTRKLVRVATTSNRVVQRLTNLRNQQQLTGHVTAKIHQVKTFKKPLHMDVRVGIICIGSFRF